MCGGNCVQRVELAECMSKGGSYTNWSAAIEPDVSDIMAILHGSFLLFIFFVSGFPCLRTSTIVWKGVILCPFGCSVVTSE